MIPVEQTFALALQHHQAGRLADAEKLYREVLAVQPDHPGSWHLLGVVAHQFGSHDRAVDLIRRAVLLDPHNAAAYSNLGVALAALRRFDEAIAAYRQALDLKHDLPETYLSLGTALRDQGKFDEAAGAYRRALELKPNFAKACNNLGVVLAEQGQFDEAIAAYRSALKYDPADGEAHYNLGNALEGRGRLDEAMAAYLRTLELQPSHAEAHNNLGNALMKRGQVDEAVASFLRALHLKPDDAEGHNNLGNALMKRGQCDEAVIAYRRALELRPDFARAHYNLGAAMIELGQCDEAVTAYRRALEIRLGYMEAHNNLGAVLTRQGYLDDAIVALHRALAIAPNCAEAFLNLGNAHKDRGELDAAVGAYRRAIELEPGKIETYSGLLFTLHYLPGFDERMIAEEQRRWNRQVSASVEHLIHPRQNDRDPERRLRIGYVSPDFRDHVLGRNILPLFKGHDSQDFEIFCYSGVVRSDPMTEEFRRRAAGWRDAAGLGDETLASLIHRDRVDILVDLSQHSGGNRLPVFARRPAPVQVSFAGYPESTGLEVIGCRISDRWLEACSPEMGDGSSEFGWKLGPELRTPNSDLRTAERVCLIDSFWCYDPLGTEVPINELPAKTSGRVTFGSLGNFCKVNDEVLKLWARVLTQVKDSRLVLLSGFGGHRERTKRLLAEHGIEAQRVEFLGRQSRNGYLEMYHLLDVALDPFPYGGHTTSLDALWMGVPVVTLAGATRVSRGGRSILNNLGLPELVADSEEGYVKIASGLAGDLPRLAELRQTLRSRLEASVLMDASRFARQIEAAFRAMWRRWCAEGEP